MCVLEAEPQEVYVPSDLLKGQLFFPNNYRNRSRIPGVARCEAEVPAQALRTEAHLSYAVRVLACWPVEQEAALLSFGRERGYSD